MATTARSVQSQNAARTPQWICWMRAAALIIVLPSMALAQWPTFMKFTGDSTDSHGVTLVRSDQYNPWYIMGVYPDAPAGIQGIYYRESSDGGKTWGSITRAFDCPDASALTSGDVKIDQTGNVYAAWSEIDTIRFEHRVRFARFDHAMWDTTTLYTVSMFSVQGGLGSVFLSLGQYFGIPTIHLAFAQDWTAGADGTEGIHLASMDGGFNWTAASMNFPWQVDSYWDHVALAANDNGWVYDIYMDNRNGWNSGDLYLLYSTDNGASWYESGIIDNAIWGNTDEETNPNLVARSDSLFLSYTRNGNLSYKYSSDNGTTWNTGNTWGMPLTSSGQAWSNARQPMPLDELDRLHLVWGEVTAGVTETYHMAISKEGAVLSPAEIVSPVDGISTSPDGAVANRHTIVVSMGQQSGMRFPGYVAYQAPPQASLTFRVDMRPAMMWGRFNPLFGDSIIVRGSLASLDWFSTNNMLTDPDGDSVYTITVGLDSLGALLYKFVIRHGGIDFWEFDSAGVGGNRSYLVGPGIDSLPIASYCGLPPHFLNPGEYAKDPAAAGLWHLNDDHSSAFFSVSALGQVMFDQSGWGNHGYYGSADYQPGRFGLSEGFHGAGQHIIVPHHPSLNLPDGSMTVEASIRTTDSLSGKWVVGKNQINGFALYVQGTQAHAVLIDDFSNVVSLYGTSNISDGRWHHLALVWGGPEMRLYVDGTQEAAASTSSLTGTIQNTEPLYISRSGSEFLGDIDEVRVSKVARTSQEFNIPLPPSSVSANANGTTIHLSWGPGSGTPIAQYFIYRGADSINVALVDSAPGPAYDDVGRSIGVTYFYRIRSVEPSGLAGPRSAAVYATPSIVLGVPSPVSPPDGVSGVLSPVTFQWTPASGATSYGFQMALDPLFASGLYEVSVGANQFSAAGFPFVPNMQYYWRVRAVAAPDTGAWSSASTFWFTNVALPPASSRWMFDRIFFNSPAGGAGVHGLTVDPNGYVWIAPFGLTDSVFDGSAYRRTRALYVFSPSGTQAAFSPIKIVTGPGITDTLYGAGRGLATDQNGNILYCSGDVLYRINYTNGQAIGKVTPAAGLALTAPAVDAAGNIYVTQVLPGNPIHVFNPSLTEIAQIPIPSPGYSRTIAVTPSGNDVFWPSYNQRTVFRFHSDNGAAGPYVLADTLLNGLAIESMVFNKWTGLLWVSTGSDYDLPVYPTPKQTWLAYNLLTRQIADTIGWNMIPGTLDDRPRGIGFSPGGDTAYVASFSRDTSAVQMFVSQRAADLASAYFNGGNARVRIVDGMTPLPGRLGDQSGYQITGSAITVEAWVFLTGLPTVGNHYGLVSRPFIDRPNNPSYELRIDNPGPGNNARYAFLVTDGDTSLARSAEAIGGIASTGTWTHVAGTFDGTVIRLYINGSLVADAPFTGMLGPVGTGLYIGGQIGVGYTNGLVDEARIWNTVHTPAQIQALMNRTLTGTEVGLRGYWPLEEIISLRVKDLSRYENDLVVQNATIQAASPAGGMISIPATIGSASLSTALGDTLRNRVFVGGWPLPTVTVVSGPAGLTVDTIPAINWAPQGIARGRYTAVLQATNPSGSAQGTYTIWVDTTSALRFLLQSNNNIAASLYPDGKIGGPNDTIGLRFQGLRGLYMAQPMVAIHDTQVIGGIYNSEYAPLTPVAVTASSLPGFDLALQTSYDDFRAPSPVGIKITQVTHTKSTFPDRDYMVVEYVVQNQSSSTLSNVYIGFGADWDIGVPSNNSGGFDAARGLVYMYEVGGSTNPYYYGMKPLRGRMSGYSVAGHAPDADTMLYRKMTTFGADPMTTDDLCSVFGTGPYTIPAGGTARVVLALLAGTNLPDLQATADRAQAMFSSIAVNEVEPNDSSVTAQQILLGDNVDGAIASNVDVDYYKYAIRAGDTVTVSAWDRNSSGLNMRYDVYNRSGGYLSFGYYPSPMMVVSDIVSPVDDTLFVRMTYRYNWGGGFPASMRPKDRERLSTPVPLASVKTMAYDSGTYRLNISPFVASAPILSDYFMYCRSLSAASAALDGVVQPRGLATDVLVEYGVSAFDHAVTPPGNPFSGLDEQWFSVFLTGLTPSTTYRYRIIATNAAGIDTSAVATFTTAPPPVGWVHTPTVPDEDIRGVSLGTSVLGLAGSTNGGVYRTTDGGLTWNQSGTTVHLIESISMSGGFNAIAVGSGYASRTTDGGFTWSAQYLPSGPYLYRVKYASPSRIFAVGDAGVILSSTDGGATWSPQTSGVSVPLYGLSFRDSLHGLVVGHEGTILKTTNGGANWTALSSGISSSLHGVQYIDDTTAIVVGDSFIMLRTTDDGATWVLMPAAPAYIVYDVSFSDRNSGVLCGANGTIARSTDGGLTWQLQQSGTYNYLVSVDAVSYNRVVVGGWSGSIVAALDLPPATPTGLTATPASERVSVKWSANTEYDLLRYRIYGGTSANPTTLIDSTTGGRLDTAKTFLHLVNGTTYHYRIVAVDSAGITSPYSLETSATPSGMALTEVEPNDSASQAEQMYYADWLDGSISSSADIDYYKIAVTAGDTLTVSAADRNNSDLNLGFYVFNGTGGMVAEGYYPANTNVVSNVVAEQNDTFFVRIRYRWNWNGWFPASIRPRQQTRTAASTKWAKMAEAASDSGTYRLSISRFVASRPLVWESVNVYGISSTFAVLNTVVIPNGLETGVRFEYGTTTFDSTVIAGASSNSIYQTDYQTVLHGLAPSTQYKLRVIAANAAGADTSQVVFFTTAPMPVGWTVRQTDPSDYLSAVSFGSSTTGMAVSYWSGRVYRTTDGGANWNIVRAGVPNPWSVAVSGLSNAIVVGNEGLILQTTDGGATWADRSMAGISFLQRVRYASPTVLFAVGNGGTILRSTNGGAAWTAQNSGTSADLYSCSFIDANRGFAVGYGGVILKTTNGGSAWTAQASGSTEDLYGVAAINDTVVIAVGSGSIRRTTNGGTSWNSVPGGTGQYLFDVSFSDQNSGVACGTGGTILRTTDQGMSWQSQQSGTYTAMLGTQAISYNRVVAVGEYGIVVTSVDLPPAKPQNLAASAHSEQVSLRWSANTEYDLLRYRIYGGTSANPTTLIDSTTGGRLDTTKTFLHLVNGTTYHYRIVAVDSAGQYSPYSDDVSITPNTVSLTEAEPNDSAGVALQLYYGDTVDGTISPAGDRDYYKFSALPGDTVSVFADAGGASGLYVSADVYRWDGVYVGQAWSPTYQHVQTNVRINNAGTYYVRLAYRYNYGAFPQSIRDLKPGALQSEYISRKLMDGTPDTGAYRLTVTRFRSRTPAVYDYLTPYNIVSNAMTVEASILPNGLPTSVRFEYGTSLSFGSSVNADANPYPGIDQTGATARLTGLAPNTAYYVRAIVTNSAGADTSLVQPVSTPETPVGWVARATPVGLPMFGVSFGSASTGIAAGGNGTMLRTTDGGATWSLLSSGTTNDLFGVSMPDASQAVAVGANGAILTTASGGTSWTDHSVVGQTLRSVRHLTSTTVVAVGDGGRILRSTDSGANWTTPASPTTNSLFGLSFANASAGMAVGGNGTILKTTDGGQTWTSLSSGSGFELRGVWMFDPTTAVVVGGGTTVLRTTDGGASWIPINSGAAAYWLYDVAFSDRNAGVLCGGNGTLMRTTDGGLSWVSQKPGTFNELSHIFTNSYNRVTVVGSFGTVLSSVNLPPTAPQLLSVLPGDAKVSITWTKNTEYDFMRYRIFRGTAAGATTVVDSISNASDTSRTYTGLTNKTAYYFRIAAVDSGYLQSAYSNELSGTPMAVPAVTSISPSSGPVGTVVTITGTGFSAAAANNVVYFGAVRVPVIAVSPTSLTVRVPAGVTYAPVTVTVDRLTGSSRLPFVGTFNANRGVTAATFLPKIDYTTGTGPYSTAIADVTGDGRPDILVTNFTSNTVSLFERSVGPGGFTFSSFEPRQDFASGTSPDGLTVADLDGDGRLDVLTANSGANSITVFHSEATGTATRADIPCGSVPVKVAVRDMDGDGKQDIVFCSQSSSQIGVLRNISAPGSISAGSFQSAVTVATGNAPYGFAVDDIDGDGKPDVVATSTTTNSVSFLRNTSSIGSIGFAARLDLAIGAQSFAVATGDLDGDGIPDVAVTNTTSNGIQILRNTNSPGQIVLGGFTLKATLTGAFQPTAAAIADVDGNGKPDVVSVNKDSRISVFRNTWFGNPAGSFDPHVDFAVGATPQDLSVGDLDGDGKPDVVVSNTDGGSISVLKNLAPYFEMEPNDSASVATPLAYGDSVDAQILPVLDRDYYRFDAQSGDTMRVTLRPMNSSPLRAYFRYSWDAGSLGGDYHGNPIGAVQQTLVVRGLQNYLRVAAESTPGGTFPASIRSRDKNADDRVASLKESAMSPDTGAYRLLLERYAPAAPFLNQYGALSVFSNAVTVGVSAHANGLPTSLTVDYGQTTSYGNTASGTTISGVFEEPAYAQLTNLAPTTAYHYRVSLSNSKGTVTGLDYTFATPDPPEGWISQSSGVMDDLASVQFVDSLRAYAAGGFSTILKTTNAGVTWRVLSNSIQQWLSSIAFVDANTGLVLGGSSVYKTTDGGATWNHQSEFPNVMRAIQLVGATSAVAVGDNGTIMKSTNGGASWSAQTSNVTSTLRGVHFQNALIGMVVGEGGTVLKTTDGGVTWVDVSSLSYGNLYAVRWLNTTTAIAVGTNGVLRTADAGMSWTTPPGGSTGQRLFGVTFTDASNGAAVGNGGTILRTTDGGATWNSQASGTYNPLYAVAFTSASVGTAVGAWGTILHINPSGSAPVAITGSAAAITTESAVVSASVNPSGLATQAYFEWGVTTAYGNTTAPQNLGSGTSALAVSDTLRALIPNTVYHYRIVAVNALDTTRGADGTFTTQALVVPKPPAGLQVTAVSTSQINLVWADSSNNEDGFYIERRKVGTAFARVDSVEPDETSWSDLGLQPATRYYYRVQAFNIVGVSAYSNVDSTMTQSLPTTKPADPTLLVATARSTTEIDLSWKDNSNNEVGFKIQRKLVGGSYAVIDSVSADVTSYQNRNLTESTTYIYQVYAYNAAGASLPTNEDTATTLSPVPVASLSASRVDFASVEVGVSSRDSAISLTNTGAANLDISSITITGPDAAQFSIVTVTGGNSLSPGGTKNIRLRFQPTSIGSKTAYLQIVTNDVSQGTPPGTLVDTLIAIGIDTYPPTAPVGVDVSPTGWSTSNVFTITWTGPTDPSGIINLWYLVDVAPTSGSPGDSMSISGSSAQVHLASLGKHVIYFYFQDGAGNKNPSSAVSVTVRYDNAVPIISHNSGTVPAITVESGAASPPAVVEASATDGVGQSGVKSLQLEYRRTGDQAVGTLDYAPPFAQTSTQTIPSSIFVTNASANGVEYRLVAMDTAGNTTSTRWYSVSVRNGVTITVSNPTSFPAASAYPSTDLVKAYRLFSVPYLLDVKKPDSFMVKSLGEHSKDGVNYVNWRMQRYVNAQKEDYEAFKNQDAVVPGAGFFLIVNETGKKVTVGSGQVVSSDLMNDTGLPLTSGWNILGNPLLITVPFDSLVFVGGQPTDWAYYTGTGSTSGWEKNNDNAKLLKPWEGLAIRVDAASTVKFKVIGPQPGIKEEGLHVRMQKTELPLAESPGSWFVDVGAFRTDNSMRSLGNGFGMVEGASDGHDRFDSYQPPLVGDRNVAVYFVSEDGGKMKDIRQPSKEGGDWQMRVVTGDEGARVKLQFGDVAVLPDASFEAFVIDVDQKMAHNLKTVRTIEINSGKGVRNFHVVVGSRQFVQDHNAGVELYPSTMRLYANYPNPFNPETVIRYTVPNHSPSYHVTLKVYNILGQDVATVVDEMQETGYYEVTFNARALSSGVYFYRISVQAAGQSFSGIRRMVLMK